jgi:hypothetical protein
MHMRKSILSVFFILSALTSSAQIYLNPGVDTSFKEVRAALKFYDSYLLAFKGKTIPDMAKYWPAAELKMRTIPDQLIYAINDYPLYSLKCQVTILYVRPTDKYVHIKTQIASIDSLKQISTMAVTNSYVAFDAEGQPYFISPLTLNLADWHNRAVRNITFYYPAYHQFDSKRADTLVREVKKLENDWNLKPIDIRYYVTSDIDELAKLRGFDYTIMMGNKVKPTGFSDEKDHEVYCAGLGENYFHEVVHVYLNPVFPKSPLQEGMAVFYGGSMGHQINWHLKRVNQYLLEHPKVDLTNFDDFWYTDPYTAIQGMLVSLVYQKDGLPGLKRLMQYTTYDEIFEKEFDISKDHVNAFLRKEISEQSAH